MTGLKHLEGIYLPNSYLIYSFPTIEFYGGSLGGVGGGLTTSAPDFCTIVLVHS
jgi:hypothetical protein